MTRRKVRIVKHSTKQVWFVSYVSRRPRGHYVAAQFDMRDHSQDDVRRWIEQQPNLVLVNINSIGAA